jgi:hypothetical protein
VKRQESPRLQAGEYVNISYEINFMAGAKANKSVLLLYQKIAARITRLKFTVFNNTKPRGL